MTDMQLAMGLVAAHRNADVLGLAALRADIDAAGRRDQIEDCLLWLVVIDQRLADPRRFAPFQRRQLTMARYAAQGDSP